MNWEPETADPQVGSFLPGLRWVVERTSGPILELGGGYFSTPYLHTVATTGRIVHTYEFDLEWANELCVRFDSSTHRIGTDFETMTPFAHWGVALIDCEGWNRQAFYDMLNADVFVIHDSQDHWVSEASFDARRYRYDFGKDGEPKTTLLSDVIDVRECGL